MVQKTDADIMFVAVILNFVLLLNEHYHCFKCFGFDFITFILYYIRILFCLPRIIFSVLMLKIYVIN
jgi:hypothetical protein